MPEDHSGSGAPGRPPAIASDDAAALERLRALSAGPARQSPAPEPQRSSSRRGAVGAKVRSAVHRPPAAKRGGGLSVARIAAPAVFLVAVLVLVLMLFQSGMIGGGSAVTVSPSPTASGTKGGKSTPADGTKVYVVKTGDTLSGIAVKFDTTTSVIEDLNPKLSTSTLAAGAKIKVPTN
jgi:nucleoid-associated protein YgaU